jgi:hypothetical protein
MNRLILAIFLALSPVAASAHYLDFSKLAFWNVRDPPRL